MQAVIKYRNVLRKRKDLLKNKEELLKYFRQELARENFLAPSLKKGRQLRKIELIELLNYLDKPEVSENVQSIRVPSFYNLRLDQHEILLDKDEPPAKRMKLGELDSKKSKIRFNAMLSDLKEKWIESNFELTEKQLLDSINKDSISKYLLQKKKS
jgi:hypothetical protein